MRETRIYLLVLAAIVLAGALLRFWSLGTRELSAPELAYHFAAEAAVNRGEPILPSGERFDSGQPLIGVIGALQRLLRDPETSVRLPSALLGTAALILFAGSIWMIAGPWAAIVATFFLAFYPEAIRQSRTAGLNSFQQLCGVVALAAGWLATSRATPQRNSPATDLIRRWIWAGVAVAALLLGALAQLSALTVFAAFATWVLLLALAAVWTGRWGAFKNNVAVQLVAAGIIALLAIVVLRPEIFDALQAKARSLPALPSGASTSASFFIFSLGSQFAWAFTLLPALVLFAGRKHTWLSLYLFTWITIPLLAHSAFIVRKEERFLLMAVPALFFLAGLAAADAREGISRAISVHLREWNASYRSSVQAGNAVAAVLLAFALATVPAVNIALGVPRAAGESRTSDWVMLRSVFQAAPASGVLPLGSADPLSTLFYLSRADFGVGTEPSRIDTDENRPLNASRFRPATDDLPIDRWSGVPLAASLAAIRGAFGPYSEVYIALDVRDFETGLVAPEVRSSLISGADELCRARCGNLRLFHWRLQP